MKLLTLVVLATTLTACAGHQTTQQNIAGVCQGIASAEQALSTVKLSDSQKAVVKHAIAIKAPVCNSAPFPTSLDAAVYASLTGALADLTAVKEASK